MNLFGNMKMVLTLGVVICLFSIGIVHCGDYRVAKVTSQAFKQIGNLNSAIGALLDNIIETVKTDVTTALRQEYQQKLNETSNQLNAKITTAIRQEYQQKLDETINQLKANITTTMQQEYQQKLDETTNQLKANITSAMRQEYQQKLDETTNQLDAKITTSMRQEYQQKLNENTNQINIKIIDLQTKYNQLKVARWPSGSYCILANGACPAGFEQKQGYMKAISQYGATASYIKEATFGSSKISCRGRCGQYGNWVGDLYLTTCCK